MLAPKISGKLAKTIIEPAKALVSAGVNGHVLGMMASWHRTINDGKEMVDMANFSFLVGSNGKPLQVDVSYENGKFDSKVTDLSSEMGDVREEEEFRGQLKLLSDAEIIAKIEEDQRIQDLMKKAKHLRVFSMSFILYDEEFQRPVWQVILKNWPLTNFFKREKPVTVELVVDALQGKIMAIQRYF